MTCAIWQLSFLACAWLGTSPHNRSGSPGGALRPTAAPGTPRRDQPQLLIPAVAVPRPQGDRDGGFPDPATPQHTNGPQKGAGFRTQNRPQEGEAPQWGFTLLRPVLGPESGP